jgi:hypothetical protein
MSGFETELAPALVLMRALAFVLYEGVRRVSLLQDVKVRIEFDHT